MRGVGGVQGFLGGGEVFWGVVVVWWGRSGCICFVSFGWGGEESWLGGCLVWLGLLGSTGFVVQRAFANDIMLATTSVRTTVVPL